MFFGWAAHPNPRWYFGESDSEEEFYHGSSEDEEEEEDDAQRQDPSWPFASIGASNEKLVPKGEILKEMSTLLGKVDNAQTKSSFGDEAKILSGLPGLTIKGGSLIGLPVRQENAVEMETLGTQMKSKVWVLSADKVQVKSSEWVEGIEKICKLGAEKMGFKDIPLRPVLDKVVLYGEGGCLDRQRDGGGDRSVGRLEVQLPSVFTGGDLLVYEEGTDKQTRYKMGKEQGTAEFVPHYVVYTAGAYRAVEKVVSGFRLVMVYSLCLPSGMPSLNGKNPTQMKQTQLAEIVKKLTTTQGDIRVKGEPEAGGTTAQKNDKTNDNAMIAMMLSRSCAKCEIERRGSESLSGVDSQRFQTLRAANALVPPRQRLKFYIARLHYSGNGYYTAWSGNQTQESASWYSIEGQKLDTGALASFAWTKRLNFLNPGGETFAQLWKRYDAYHILEQERFAIVGWPVTDDFMNSFTLIGEVAATTTALADNPVDISKVKELFRCRAEKLRQDEAVVNPTVGYRYGVASSTRYGPRPIPLPLCQKLGQAIADSGDVTLVAAFIENQFSLLREKRQMIPVVAAMVHKVSWTHFHRLFVTAIEREPFVGRMGLTLALAEALVDNAIARDALTKFAVENAHFSGDNQQTQLASFGDVGLLWKHANACESPQVFLDVVNLYRIMDGKLLGSVVELLSKGVDASCSQDYQLALATLATRRKDWLIAEVADITTPFTCEVLDKNFPDSAQLVAFLRGPDPVLHIQGFTGIAQARIRVALLHKKIKGRVVMTAKGRGRQAFVLVVKAGSESDVRKQKVPRYKMEIERMERLVCTLNGSAPTGTKRPREEESKVIAID